MAISEENLYVDTGAYVWQHLREGDGEFGLHQYSVL